MRHENYIIEPTINRNMFIDNFPPASTFDSRFSKEASFSLDSSGCSLDSIKEAICQARQENSQLHDRSFSEILEIVRYNNVLMSELQQIKQQNNEIKQQNNGLKKLLNNISIKRQYKFNANLSGVIVLMMFFTAFFLNIQYVLWLSVILLFFCAVGYILATKLPDEV